MEIMSAKLIAQQKEWIRKKILEDPFSLSSQEGASSDAPPVKWGKAAERLRRLPCYSSARTVLVAPVSHFRQIALNALVDRKRLILPSPQLRFGFFLVSPENVPPGKRSAALNPHKSNPYARKIDYSSGRRPQIDLIVTPSLAASRDGSRLGDGQGHLDLQVACLNSLKWIHRETQVITVLVPFQLVPPLPMKPTDVGVHWIVTPHEAIQTRWNLPLRMPILWPLLDRKTIRKNDALFYINGVRMKKRSPRPASREQSKKRRIILRS